jgi:hypothetical protein
LRPKLFRKTWLESADRALKGSGKNSKNMFMLNYEVNPTSVPISSGSRIGILLPGDIASGTGGSFTRSTKKKK